MVLFLSIVNASNHTKCVSPSNQRCMTQPTLINLHPNEYSQEFYFYTFAVKSRCNTLNDLSNKVCVPNKKEDSNLSVFNMITGINESITLTKDISCKWECRFDEKKCNSDQWWNNNKCHYECKKRHLCEKDYIWNPTTCNCENGKYLASMIDDSAISCDKVIESYDKETKTIPATFNEKKAACKIDICYYLLLFDKTLSKTKTFITISRQK